MKKQLLLALLCISIYAANSQTPAALPDFNTAQTIEEKSDKIGRWYTDYIYKPRLDSAKAFFLLSSLEKYARTERDPLLLCISKFYKGYYISNGLNHPEIGDSLMAECINDVGSLGNPYVKASIIHDRGVLYLVGNNRAKALEFQLRALEIYKKIGYENIREISSILFDLAYLYYHLGNYSSCLELMLEAQKYPSAGNYINFQVLNTTGLAYRGLGMNDSARYYFELTLQKATLANDTPWIGIASGNIGLMFIKEKEYEKAYPYVKKDYDCLIRSLGRFTGIEISGVLTELAEISIARGKIDEALGYLKRAENSVKESPSVNLDFNRILKQLYKLQSRAYLHKRDFANADRYLLLFFEVDAIIKQQENGAQLTKVQIQLEAEKNLAHLKQVESENELNVQRRNLWIAVLILILLLSISYYNRIRIKQKKDALLSQAKQKALETEKQQAEMELKNYIQILNEKNNVIESFEKELHQLNQSPDQKDKYQTYEMIEKLQKSTIITEDGWFQFKDLFDKVHKGFFIKLKQKYPDLTQAETRLLALTKLNISTKEMAAILGISPDSIRKARYRFLKKINRDETDWEKIVNDI
ncbi:MAG: hypothetical protein V4590_01715 [Bacteroidota bacterium]